MPEKKQSEKQKSKIRITAGEGTDKKTRSAAERLAELEAEIKTESHSAATPAPLLEPDKVSMRQTAATLFATHGTKKKLFLFWGVLLGSLILARVPGADILFTPLSQFATLVHEISHAIVCVLTGGHVTGMTIVADGQGHGGLTNSQGGIPFFVTQAGYLGTAVFGSFLVFLSQYHKLSKGILIGIGSAIGLASLFFILPAFLTANFFQVFFSLLWALAMAAATIYAGLKLKDSNANLLLLCIATYTAMDSLRAITILIQAAMIGSAVWSDATNMEQMYILPAIFWSFLWVTLSAVMLGTTVWLAYWPKQLKPKKIAGASSKFNLMKKKN